MTNLINIAVTKIAQEVAESLATGQPTILVIAFREAIQKCYLDVIDLQRTKTITAEKMVACAVEAAQSMAGCQPKSLHMAFEQAISEKFVDVLRLEKSSA